MTGPKTGGRSSEDYFLGLFNPLFEDWRGDGALVDVEERNVVIGHLMQKDDELYEIRVCLLPERFLAATEEVV